jgi:hypothetical protein
MTAKAQHVDYTGTPLPKKLGLVTGKAEWVTLR